MNERRAPDDENDTSAGASAATAPHPEHVTSVAPFSETDLAKKRERPLRPSGAALALGTVGAALVLVMPLRRLEERWLARRFGKELKEEHRARVPAFVPRLRSFKETP